MGSNIILLNKVYGGGDRKEQVANCERGVEIIIATPGRLYDFIQAHPSSAVDLQLATGVVISEPPKNSQFFTVPQDRCHRS